MIVASEEAVERHGLKPLARVLRELRHAADRDGAHDRVQRRRLPRAVCAEERGHLSCRNLEADVVDDVARGGPLYRHLLGNGLAARLRACAHTDAIQERTDHAGRVAVVRRQCRAGGRLAQRQRGGIAAAFVLLVALLGLWYVREAQALTDARREADRERAVADGLRARKAALQPYAALESQIAAAEQLRAKVYAREVRFSGIMQDISAIIPGDVWLTQMNAAVTATACVATAPMAPRRTRWDRTRRTAIWRST